MTNIVILHGLYMHGIVMLPLAKKLQGYGYNCHVISYPSLKINQDRLFDMIDEKLDKESENILVGHSLGGILATRYVNQRNDKIIKSIIAVGSPLQGASIAQVLQEQRFGFLLGNSSDHGLLEPIELPECPLASIAGTLPFGMRTPLLMNKEPSDGTVTVAETQLEGLADHICLPQSHTSLIYSRKTVEQIAHFIEHEMFEH